MNKVGVFLAVLCCSQAAYSESALSRCKMEVERQHAINVASYRKAVEECEKNYPGKVCWADGKKVSCCKGTVMKPDCYQQSPCSASMGIASYGVIFTEPGCVEPDTGKMPPSPVKDEDFNIDDRCGGV